LVLPLVLLIGWEILSQVGFFPPNLLPAPSAVLATIWELAVTGELFRHIAVTLYRVACGFVIGTAVATVLGALTGYSRLAHSFLDPFL
jgi:sulfonate transport system permease protein